MSIKIRCNSTKYYPQTPEKSAHYRIFGMSEGIESVSVEVSESLAEEFRKKYGFRLDECENPIDLTADRIFQEKLLVEDLHGTQRYHVYNVAILDSLDRLSLDEIIPFAYFCRKGVWPPSIEPKKV
jgi:hypothetical protein